MATQSGWLGVEEVVENPVISDSAIGVRTLLRISTLWAARVSNPARRIKRHVVAVLACAAPCSFVLVSAGTGVGYMPVRPAPCRPSGYVR